MKVQLSEKGLTSRLIIRTGLPRFRPLDPRSLREKRNLDITRRRGALSTTDEGDCSEGAKQAAGRSVG